MNEIRMLTCNKANIVVLTKKKIIDKGLSIF